MLRCGPGYDNSTCSPPYWPSYYHNSSYSYGYSYNYPKDLSVKVHSVNHLGSSVFVIITAFMSWHHMTSASRLVAHAAHILRWSLSWRACDVWSVRRVPYLVGNIRWKRLLYHIHRHALKLFKAVRLDFYYHKPRQQRLTQPFQLVTCRKQGVNTWTLSA